MKKTLGYISICFIWGTTWLAIKVGYDDLTPFFGLGIRFLISGLILLGFLIIKYNKIPEESKDIKLIIYLSTLSFIVPYTLIYWGEQFIYSDIASVIFAVFPINVSILSFLFLKEERFSLTDLLGVITGFAGIVIFFSHSLFSGTGFHTLGMIAIFMGSFSQSALAVILKKHGKSFHPLKINLFPLMISGVLITGFSFLIEDIRSNSLTLLSSSSVLYLSIFGTIFAFWIYLWLLQNIKLSTVSTVALITPIVAIIAGWIVLDEKLSAAQLTGSVFVLGGVLLTIKEKKRPVPIQ